MTGTGLDKPLSPLRHGTGPPAICVKCQPGVGTNFKCHQLFGLTSHKWTLWLLISLCAFSALTLPLQIWKEEEEKQNPEVRNQQRTGLTQIRVGGVGWCGWRWGSQTEHLWTETKLGGKNIYRSEESYSKLCAVLRQPDRAGAVKCAPYQITTWITQTTHWDL